MNFQSGAFSVLRPSGLYDGRSEWQKKTMLAEAQTLLDRKKSPKLQLKAKIAVSHPVKLLGWVGRGEVGGW